MQKSYFRNSRSSTIMVIRIELRTSKHTVLAIENEAWDDYQNKMYARRTSSFSRERIRYSNSARMNKSNFTTEKIV